MNPFVPCSSRRAPRWRFGLQRTPWVVSGFVIAFAFSFLVAAGGLHAQNNAIVRGRVIDSATGEAMFGVAVVVREAKAFAQTDFDGKYELSLPPGAHRIVFQMMSYRETVQVVTVGPGQQLSVNAVMNVQTMQEVVVKDRAVNNTQASILNLQKKSGTVSDGVSEESIKRSPDSSASDVMKRVTGISLIGGKYVFVRGLGERYSTTLLNGTVLPSPEPDRRVVPLDLFPASLIKNIRVIKSFMPEYTGEFSGGLVMIDTKEYPDQLEVSLGIGVESNSETTGRPFKAIAREYGNDYLGLGPNSITGLGSKNWAVPGLAGALPDLQPLAATNGLSADMVKLGGVGFDNSWSARQMTAPYGRNFSFSIGDSLKFGGQKLGYVFGTYYKRKYETTHEEEYRWQVGPAFSGAAFGKNAFYINDYRQMRRSDMYRDSVLWGNNLNLAWQLSPDHQIYTKTFFSTNSEKSFRQSWSQRNDADVYNFIGETSNYVAREIMSETVGGDHGIRLFSDGKPHKLHWHYNYAWALRDEPELKNRLWQRNVVSSDSTFIPDANDGTRYVSKTQDESRTLHVDYELPFSQWSGREGKLKLGYENLDREKAFGSRIFRTTATNPDGLVAGAWPVPGEVYLNPARVYSGDMKVTETVGENNTYRAIQRIDSTFIQSDLPVVSKLRFAGGVRQERSYQKAVTRKSNDWKSMAVDYNCLPKNMQYYHPTLIENRICPENNNGVGEDAHDDVLPAANLIYELADNMNLRLAYSETVTRPDLRELSSFAFSPYFGAERYLGNPSLTRSYIHNYDFRWEWYFTSEEYAGIGLFEKSISGPIETVGTSDISSATRSFTLVNSPHATIKGLELDLRTDFLKRFRAETNFYAIRSTVQVMDYAERYLIASGQLSRYDRRAITSPTNLERPLQGQSDMVYNVGLSYFLTENKKSNVGLFYNYFGDRIIYVGAQGAPDTWERGRGTLDLVATYEPKDGLTIKAAVKNLTNPEVLLYQDSDVFGLRFPYQRYRRGQEMTISAAYKF